MSEIRFGAPAPPAESEGPRQIEVPPGRYTSTEFMELERAYLWPDTWLVAGFASDVAKSGDYFVFELGQESILVVRDREGRINAFHNVCLHRGHLLRDPGLGTCDAFVCPYHNWEWGLDGALRSVPNRSRFPQGFPADRRRLSPVTCRVWAGLVWVSMNEPRETLEEYLGPIHEHVGPYRLEEFRVGADWTADWQCNWKTAIDGFNETYHGPATHPQFSEFLDTLSASFQFGQRHSVFIIKHGVRPPSADSDEILEPIAGMVRRAGADPTALRGRPDEARALVQRWIRDEAAREGRDLSGLSDSQLTDTHHFYAFPNVHIDFHGAGDVTVQRFRPHATDPDRCLLDVIDLKRDRAESPASRPPHEHVGLGAKQRGLVYAQDIERLSRIQRGMHSRGFRGPHLSQMERRIYHMHLVIDDYLGAHVTAPFRTQVSPPAPNALP
jgi:phenylpropionate dioxygenase-like ring-hydroxylating dioxygenase large terminal subunit